ncbi:hypothetical protein D3C78_1141830 [compost metagenome]
MLERVHRGAISHAEGSGGVEVHRWRDRQHVVAWHGDLLGKAAPAGQGHDPVTDFQVADFFTHCADHAGRFTTRRKREGRLELVFALDDQRIGEVHPGGVHVQQDFILLRDRTGDVFQHQRFGRAEGFAQHGFHQGYSFGSDGR